MRPERAAGFLAALCGGALFVIFGWIVLREILLGALPVLFALTVFFGTGAWLLGWRGRR